MGGVTTRILAMTAREGKGREGKGREGKGREGKGRDGMGWDGMGWDGMGWPPPQNVIYNSGKWKINENIACISPTRMAK